MKKPLLLLICVLCVHSFSNAQNFAGTWKGTMVQDSPSRRIDFELVLEQKEGKIEGYLYRLFIVNDTLVYNTVKVEGRIADKMLVVEDMKSVSRNFEERADRVRAVYFFKLDKENTDSLKGEWTTNRIRRYMAITGTVTLVREPRYETTQLFKRLEEKQLHTTIAFVPKKKAEDIAVNAPKKKEELTEAVESKKPAEDQTSLSKLPASIADTKPETVQTDSAVSPTAIVANTKPEPSPLKVNTNAPLPKTDSSKLVAVNVKPQTPEPSDLNKTKPSAVPQQQTPTVAPNPVANNKPQPIAGVKESFQTPSVPPEQNTKPVVNEVVKTEPSKQPSAKPAVQPTPPTPIAVNTVVSAASEKPAAALSKTNAAATNDSLFAKQNTPVISGPPVINNPVITKRETEIIQTLEVFEDSITLSLYDNGEIDGDTVSVFFNNEKIINQIGLKASAYKQTIYFKPGETVQLTLFAENLGTVPPNSGLLVVYSGEKRYQVFFTSTLNKSAVVLLKRTE